MKAVILAAGEGVRMRPLTLEKPKPMLEVGGLPIIHRLLKQLPPKISEIVVVIGYLGEKIQEYIGNEFLGRKVNYVWQKDKSGTFGALLNARKFLNNEPFGLFFADDILHQNAINEVLEHSLALVAADVADPKPFGVIVFNPDGTIAEIEEKPEHPKSNSVMTTAYALTPDIFKYAPMKRPNGELYLSEALNAMAKEHPIKAIKTEFWLPIGTPEDLKRANELFGKD